MHPASDIRGKKSKKLDGKTIVLAVTGSIAAVETIRLSRELIRNGATIIPVMTPSATRIIHPDALWFATGYKPIIQISGETEHVTFCGKGKDTADLLLLCPCTANTISKIALGIDDTAVTTFATTAIGSHIPIIIVPAMHAAMYDHDQVQANVNTCKQMGISVIEPALIENKAKMSSQEDIIALVFQTLQRHDLSEKKILIIGGATCEPIDDVRVLTNHSSGKTAVALAQESFERGAQVTLWMGAATASIPNIISSERFMQLRDLKAMIHSTDLKEYDAIIVCAALADYLPKKQHGKIRSGRKHIEIVCLPSEKILPILKEKSPHSAIIAFKVEESMKSVKSAATKLLEKYDLFAVIGNTIEGFSADSNEILVVQNKKQSKKYKDSKDNLAKIILDLLV